MKFMTIAELIAEPLRTGLSRAGSATSRHAGLTLSSVRNGRLDLTAIKPIDLTQSELDRYQIRAGAFYIVRGNGRLSLVGRGALAPDVISTQVAFPDLLIEVVPNQSLIDPQYLALVWNEGAVRSDIERRARTSSGIHKINLANLRAVRLPVPTLARQLRIVAQLSEQLAAASRASDLARGRRDAIGLLRHRALDDTFAKADAWRASRALRDVLRPRNEIVHPRDHPTGEAMFVGLEHIQSDTGIRIGGQTIRLQDLTGRKARFYAGDIVYGYLRPYLNKVWLADSTGFCSVDQYVFKVDASVAVAEYVTQFMRSSLYLSNAPIESTPGQLPRIRTEEVLTVPIPLPELAEQHRIAADLRQQLSTIDAMGASVGTELEAIDALPTALLRRAFEDIAA